MNTDERKTSKDIYLVLDLIEGFDNISKDTINEIRRHLESAEAS